MIKKSHVIAGNTHKSSKNRRTCRKSSLQITYSKVKFITCLFYLSKLPHGFFFYISRGNIIYRRKLFKIIIKDKSIRIGEK